MTVAVAKALLECKGDYTELSDHTVRCMQEIGRKYPNAGYGGRFRSWLVTDSREPYHSWGNGSAMRVSPVGFWVEPSWDLTYTACEVNVYSTRSAEVTHDHPEGIKGACAVADAIMFMRYRRKEKRVEAGMPELREFIETKYGYDLSRTLDEIRPGYRFNESCQDTVPQAITAFLEGEDFEDVIRTAVSLGGDCDTLTAIAGSIAEGFYGVPEELEKECMNRLSGDLREIVERFQKAKR